MRLRAVSALRLLQCSFSSVGSGTAPWAPAACYASLAKDKVLALIKDLRTQSGAPMGDVKKALEEANYDIDNAFELLRKKGVAAAAKKAARSAMQGLVVASEGDGSAVLVEINSETDFVARNESFLQLLPQVAAAALKQVPCSSGAGPDVDINELSQLNLADGRTVGDAVKEVAGKVRENVVLRRAVRLHSPGHIATYVHNAVTREAGLIAAAVSFERTDGASAVPDAPELREFGKHIAMQIVAMNPVSVTRDAIPTQLLDKEREIQLEIARKEGKPESIVERMVEGRLGKFYEEAVLLDQKFILDDKITVHKALAGVCMQVKLPLKIANFVRLKVGEGVEQAADAHV